MRTALPPLLRPAASSPPPRAVAPAMLIPSEPWVAPNDWLVYGHLHLILALPTLTLLSLSPPLTAASAARGKPHRP